MTNEKRYQAICEMLYSYDAATGNGGAQHVIRNPHEWTECKWQPFYANAAQMILDIKYQMDAKKNNSGSLAALKRICKCCMKGMEGLRGVVETIDETGEKRFVLCDGHRIIRVKEDPTSLPHVDTEKAFSSEKINNFMNVNRYGDAAELPTVPELKTYIAEKKAVYGKEKIFYGIAGKTFVDAQYLLDMLQALPDCKVIIPEKSTDPIYVVSDDGDGLLLPVRASEDVKKRAA